MSNIASRIRGCRRALWRLRWVFVISMGLGVAWNVVAVLLMGGGPYDAFTASFLVAGGLAGMSAGLFTVWSLRRRDGKESFGYGMATYYLGILVYWVCFVALERVRLCLECGSWTSFDLRDHLMFGYIFVIYGTVYFGIFLIPLNFLSRQLVWLAYRRRSAAGT
jgi:hypothetical protein